jgi:hypothetical protein
MTEWIYESPDGGRTVTRRRLITRNGDEARSLMVSYQTWWDLRNLLEISQQLIKEQELRDQNPALADLWEQYNIMKNLLNGN